MIDNSSKNPLSSRPAPAGFELNKSIGIATFVTLIISLKDMPDIFESKFDTMQTFLFVALFASLRLKIFLDHHEHFHRKPPGNMLIDFVFSITTWALYALAAASISRHIIYAYCCLTAALVISLFWCLYARYYSCDIEKNKSQLENWAIIDLIYIIPLSYIAWDLSQNNHQVCLLIISYSSILICNIYDWSSSKSWRYAYA